MSDDQLEELRVLVRSGRFVQAARDAEALIAEGALGPVEKAEVHHIASVALYQTGEPWKAVRQAQAAEGIASDWELVDLLARVRVNLVAMLAAVGDNQWAAEAGARLLADASALPTSMRAELPRVHYNLAWVSRANRDYEAMFNHLTQAIDLADPSTRFAVQARQQMAWWRYLDGQVSDGDTFLQGAEWIRSPEDWEANRENVLLNAIRSLLTGDPDTAILLAEEIATPGVQSTPLQRCWAAWIAASAALFLDHIELAESLGDSALEQAIALQSPELMNRANTLKNEIVQRKKELAGE